MSVAVRTERVLLEVHFVHRRLTEEGVAPQAGRRPLRSATYRVQDAPPSLAELGRLVAQLSAMIEAAGEVAEGEGLDDLGRDAGSKRSASIAELVRMRMESPLELVVAISGALASSGAGLLGLVKLVEYVFNAPVRIETEREQLLTRAAADRLRRADIESKYEELFATSVGPRSEKRRGLGRFDLLDAEIRVDE